MLRTIPLALILLALGCSKKDEPNSEPEPTRVTTEIKTETKVVAPEPKPAVVTLIAAGGAPQDTLRYQFEKGQRQNANVSIDASVETSVDQQKRPNASNPPIFLELAFEVNEVDEDGAAQIGVLVINAGAGKTEGFPEETVARVQQVLEGLVGVKGSYRCDPRGFIKDLVLEVPPGAARAVQQAANNVRQAIRLMHPRLPEEPVGAGGKWSVAAEFSHLGIPVAQKTVFSIKKLKLPMIVADTAGTQKAGAQTVAGSGGRTAELKSLSTESDGSVRWNLRKLVPASLASTSKMTMDTAAPAGDGTIKNVSLVVDQTLSITGG